MEKGFICEALVLLCGMVYGVGYEYKIKKEFELQLAELQLRFQYPLPAL